MTTNFGGDEEPPKKCLDLKKQRSPVEWMLFSAFIITIIFFVCQLGYFLMGPCASTDMMIMLDQSASLKKSDYDITKGFASKLVKSVTSDNNHVAVAQFSNDVEYITKGFMEDSVKIDEYLEKAVQKTPNFETRIKKALEWVARELEGETARRSAKKTLVIVVDGTSWPRVELSELNKTANLLKRIHKTEIYAIGIGTAVANSGEMIEIASGTHGDGTKFEQYYFLVDDTEKLDLIVQKIAERLCKVQWWLWLGPTLIVIIGIRIAIYVLDKREDEKLFAETEQLTLKRSSNQTSRIVMDERVVDTEQQ